jgi:hypothetical protein
MSTFANILSEVIDLKAKKSADYQGSSIKQSEYFPYGQVSFNHMLHTKILRIRSVSEQNGSQNFESLEDSLKDLIAYAAMNIEWIREQQVEKPWGFSAEETDETIVYTDHWYGEDDETPSYTDKDLADDLDRLRGRMPRNSVTYKDV